MRWQRLSAAEREQLWARSKQGERLTDIATALGRASGTVCTRILKGGGIPECPCNRAPWALSAAEQEQLFWGLAEGLGARAIARACGRAPYAPLRAGVHDPDLQPRRGGLGQAARRHHCGHCSP
jgi:hypothetical protein